MVVLIDFSESIPDQHSLVDAESRFTRHFQKPVHSSITDIHLPSSDMSRDDGRPNLNVNGFSAALSCYP